MPSSSSSSSSVVSQAERTFILQGCRDDCRAGDGRRRHEFRPYSIVVNDMCLSYGSARVFLPSGTIHVIVSVKAELVIPPAISSSTTTTTTSPTGSIVDSINSSGGGGGGDEGVIDVHVDFMHGKNNRPAEDELESTLSTLLVPHLVDPKRLCVSPGYYVWKLSIDVLVVASGGGSLIDACSLGIKAALQQTLLPNITLVHNDNNNNNNAQNCGTTTTTANDGRPTIQVDSDIRSAVHIPGIGGVTDDRTTTGNNNDRNRIPIIVTVSVLRDDQRTPLLIVDATGEEESCAFAQIHLVLLLQQQKSMTQGSNNNNHDDKLNDVETEPTICALHKAGGGAVPLGILQSVTSFAIEASKSATLPMKQSQSLYHVLQENFDIQ